MLQAAGWILVAPPEVWKQLLDPRRHFAPATLDVIERLGQGMNPAQDFTRSLAIAKPSACGLLHPFYNCRPSVLQSGSQLNFHKLVVSTDDHMDGAIPGSAGDPT